MLADFRELIDGAADAYAAAGTDASRAAGNMLRGVSLHPIDASPKSLPAGLSIALEAVPPSPLKSALARQASCFDWMTGDARLAGRIAFTEIVGPDGLLPAANLRMGVFLQSPQTRYPTHSHAAEELYLVLAGTPLWQKDDSPFSPVPPGSAVRHLSYQRHSMKTERDAFLALWLWTGDLSFSSYQIHETE
jgi:dimethylpropiothetin dethiomethylase